MIGVGELYFDNRFRAGFGADKLVFKTGDKAAGTKFKREAVAFAAGELCAVNTADKIYDCDVAFFGSPVFGYFFRITTVLCQVH